MDTVDPEGISFTRRTAGASRRSLPWWAWIAAAVLIFVAGVAGVRLAPGGSSVALWWPAAGISVLLVIKAPRNQVSFAVGLVFAVTAIANAVAGRPPEVAAAFGVANASETVIVALVLGTLSSSFRLARLNDALRFVIAVMAGAITAGALAGLIIAMTSTQMFWPTAGYVAASHAAAVSAIAPLGLLPPRLPGRRHLLEKIVQIAVLGIVIVLIFRPGAHLPLAFAPYLVLAWAAFRFPVRFVIVEALIASFVTIVLTLAGGGPFSSPALGVATGISLVEAFLVTFSVFAVIISAAQHELRATARRLDASNKLLSGGLLDARVGLAVAERSSVGTTTLWANSLAHTLAEVGNDGVWSGRLATAAHAALDTKQPVTIDANERILTVTADDLFDDHHRFAVQIVDVTDLLAAQRAKLEAELERQAAYETRKDLERQREDFVATTSHELRTPITIIAGYAELLADAPSLSAEERSWVETIERNSQRLNDLIEDLLSLSRAATAELQTGLHETIDCSVHIADVASNLSMLAERRGITILVTADTSTIRAVPTDLTRMLTNLLSNAVKFSPIDSTIAVTCARSVESRTVAIAVADSGPGMSPPELEHALDRFYRAPDAELNNIPGTGLGLSIVAELAHRNGGSIALAAGASGGLTATLEFPDASDGGHDLPADPSLSTPQTR